MSEQPDADRWKNFSLGMDKMYERSNELRREAEAKGLLKEVYASHCYIASTYLYEDAEGVFWLDLDGDFHKPRHENADFMRSMNVPEETIQRIVKQVEEAK